MSPSISRVDRVKWKIRTGRGQFNVYLIVFNQDSRKLEFFHNALLKQKLLFKRDIDVVGLAMSEEECVSITCNLLQEAYDALGEYDVGRYLE